MTRYSWYKFSELTVEQLYAVLKLRADVFVVEQDGAYLDPDGEDIFAIMQNFFCKFSFTSISNG